MKLGVPQFLVLLALCARIAVASNLDTIGVTALRALNPAITGAGVVVGHVEASLTVNTTPFTTLPYQQFTSGPNTFYDHFDFQASAGATSQPSSKFIYYSDFGSTTAQPNSSVGRESSHANLVGQIFYGAATDINGAAVGVAPGVSKILNYHANYYINDRIFASQIDVIPTFGVPRVINQSFIAGNDLQGGIDTTYDNYIANSHTTIVSAVGNASSVPVSPSTSYNSIAVGAYQGSTNVGPTYPSASRSKPDIVAPGSHTSYSTPLVSGAATLLVQAGDLGIGGLGTASIATDDRTIKALLLNGATKPTGWHNSFASGPVNAHTTVPLDPLYGAGVVNVYNSYRELAAGRQDPLLNVTTTLALNGAHDAATTTNVGTIGWNFSSLTSLAGADALAHYVFDVTTTASFAATLVWERPVQAISSLANPPAPQLNNFDLFLYDALANTSIASSTSLVDNVEHLYWTLLPGKYDLQVLKHGGSFFSATDFYALAFAVVPEPSGFALGVISALGWGIVRRRNFRTPFRDFSAKIA